MTVGLSLSFCVREFLDGKVDPNDVRWIVSCTAFSSMDEAYKTYKDAYWYDFSENDVLAMLIRIWHKLIQPRMMGGAYKDYSHNIAAGHYIEVETLPDLWLALDDRAQDNYQIRRFTPYR